MDKLTKRNRKFVEAVARTGEIGKSAISSGYHRTYGSQLMGMPKIQTALQKALEEKGVDDNKLALKLKQGLNAKTAPKKEGGKQYPDHYIRHKFLETAIKIKGGFAPEKHEIEHKQIILNITAETIKGLKDAKAITEEEAEVIEGELLEDESGS